VKENFAIVGGAGFIGSHFVEELLKNGHSVLVIDNFTSGTDDHIEKYLQHPKFTLHNLDARETDKVAQLFHDVHTVIHLASNPDIAAAALEPRIDFLNGTVITESIVEASRKANVRSILYASGSGVYGDAGNNLLIETSEINPISTYGASKLAGESLLSSYSFMFGIRAIIFRFANVVGSMQTHGVGYDFLRKLETNKNQLEILGDGSQSKSYVHVSDIVSGVLTAHEKCEEKFEIFNISTDSYLSVTEIANMAVEISGLDVELVNYSYSGGDRGWKADIPVVRLSASKLLDLGWEPKFSSRDAMNEALNEMHKLIAKN
jgi:UDP-glucose 4-epimerase